MFCRRSIKAPAKSFCFVVHVLGDVEAVFLPCLEFVSCPVRYLQGRGDKGKRIKAGANQCRPQNEVFSFQLLTLRYVVWAKVLLERRKATDVLSHFL